MVALLPSLTENFLSTELIYMTGIFASIVGVTASSIGVILKMLNLRPTAIKIDPYLNVDAG